MLILRVHNYIVGLLQFTQMPKLGHEINLFHKADFLMFCSVLQLSKVCISIQIDYDDYVALFHTYCFTLLISLQPGKSLLTKY